MASVATGRVESPFTASQVREQLERLVNAEALRSSRRSIAFLRYIVEQTLQGKADELKERTIGVEVFGKALTYDTNLDHVVRTAATELRKRINLYYSQEEHRQELRILLLPGSYVPQFRAPGFVASTFDRKTTSTEPYSPTSVESISSPDKTFKKNNLADSPRPLYTRVVILAAVFVEVQVVILLIWFTFYHTGSRDTPGKMFWQPLLGTKEPVLIVVGDVPGGPPAVNAQMGDSPVPVLIPSALAIPAVPFADTVATARVAAVLSSYGLETVIRRETTSSFADLRERPVVLIGSFNNEWSLRLTRDLRFTMAIDPKQRVIYIRDRANPQSREWHWSIDPHPGEKERTSNLVLKDYALISRVPDSQTGREIVVLGGLYTYGTEAAGDFVASPQLMSLAKSIPLKKGKHSLQIVLETDVTEGTAGPPHVVTFYED
jgi:hypothetical protein